MVDEIYEALLARAAVRSKRDFSRRWLGRAQNHYAARGDCITEATLVGLARRLARAGHRDLEARILARLFEERPCA